MMDHYPGVARLNHAKVYNGLIAERSLEPGTGKEDNLPGRRQEISPSLKPEDLLNGT